MVEPLVIAILAWLHVLFAVGWLGGGILFGFVIGPALSRLSQPASGEFFMKVVPRVLRFFQIVPSLAIVFGLLLLYAFTNGNLSLLSPTNKWGLEITIGMTIGLVAFLTGELLAVRYFHRAVRILSQATPDGTSVPPSELPQTLNKAGIAATVTVVLVTVALIFMVAAGFY